MNDLQIYTPGKYDLEVRSLIRERKENIPKLKDKGITLYMCESLFVSIIDSSSSLFLIPVIDLNSKIGFINKIGEIVIPPYYDSFNGAFWGHNNIVAVNIDEKWNVIDSNGRFLLNEWSKYMIVPSRDSRMITINSKAIMNVDNVDSFQYIKNVKDIKSVGGFRYGFARIHRNGGWGLINENGEEILPAIYEEMYSFYDYPEPTTKVKKKKDSKWELILLNDLR